MLDATTKKLLPLLDSQRPGDLRSAALRVLRELAGPEPEIARTLRELLADADASVRLQALRAIGDLRIESAMPELLARVREGGEEAEAAALAAARLGARGTRALQELMGHVAPGLRRRIAAALPAGGTASAGAAAVTVLLDSDPGVVDAAARSLLGKLSSLTAAQKRALAGQALELLQPRSRSAQPSLSPASETALIRLLAAVGDRRSEAVLWSRLAGEQPSEVRIAALRALGELPPPRERSKIALLLKCATDGDFRVAAPALMLLNALPAKPQSAREWLPLLDAPDPAARRFALTRLAGVDNAQVAEALVRQLQHPDPALRAEVSQLLGKIKQGRAALAKALREAATPEDAWRLARAQAPFASDYPPALRQQLFERACAFLEEGDRRADALFFVVREVDSRSVRDRLEARALAWRKKKAYDRAMLYLRLLTRDPACSEDLRFELAACGLRLSQHHLSAEARATDPALQQLARLIHTHETNPADRLKQTRWLQPEDLFYLGFHFAEGERQGRAFAAQALRLLIRRSPRSKLARDARTKLRSAGLD
jgi:HEAT repeat protein